MAKRSGMRSSNGSFVVKTSEAGQWEVRSPQGKVKVHTVTETSKKTIRKATRKFAPALSRLADR
jgi:hypothetical protein